jgi:phosphoglucomutase
MVCRSADRQENVYKIYAESFRDQPALGALLNEAQRIVDNALS